MRLPNAHFCLINPTKVVEYLLSWSHGHGRAKAGFFCRFGFSSDSWTTLVDSLRHHATTSEVVKVEESAFGTRYIVEGALETPDGRDPWVRAVWFVEHGERAPRFVTAYPRSKEVRT